MSEEKQPTREEIVAFLNESIEIAELRSKLQNYNTKIAVDRSEEIKALAFISQITDPKQQETEPHTFTQEEIDANPELKDAGISAGDEMEIPVQVKRKLKTK